MNLIALSIRQSYIRIAAAVAAGSGLLLHLYRQKRKRFTLVNYYKTLYYEQQANGALINAHFLFNSLASLQHFIRSHPPDTANAYVSDLAALIRIRMENIREPFVTIREELENIRGYLKVEQQRLGEQLRYTVHIDGDVDTATHIPGMVLQPFIENAVWHGIMPLPHTGTVTINFTKPDSATLQVEVIDNGIGINISKDTKKNNTKSLGIRLVKERLNILRELTKYNYNISICETTCGNQVTGTRVVITFPASTDRSRMDQFK